MSPSHHPSTRSLSFLTVVLLGLGTTACAGGGPRAGTSGTSGSTGLSEAEWSTLATPRPNPLPGAPRVTLADVRLLDPNPWGLESPLDVPLGISELVVAGLLRRRDVNFVERRRFAAAAERERRGLPRPRGAPPAGVSPGAQMILTGMWARMGLDSAYLEMRLTDAESGGILTTWRTATADRADPVALARAIVGGLVGALDRMNSLPSWTDPLPDAAPRAYRDSTVPREAVEAFLRGLAEEERWSWEGARRGYQAALAAEPGFFEAEAALARAARLRTGGTLGAG